MYSKKYSFKSVDSWIIQSLKRIKFKYLYCKGNFTSIGVRIYIHSYFHLLCLLSSSIVHYSKYKSYNVIVIQCNKLKGVVEL